MSRFALTISTDETTPETAPWYPIPEGKTGITAIMDTNSEHALAFLIDETGRLLLSYNNYHNPGVIDWHQFGHFNDDGTVEIYEPKPA